MNYLPEASHVDLSADRAAAAHRAVLVVTCLALATVVSAVASLNVAIPSIAEDTHASQTQLSWVIDAYALVFAALLLLGGAIGDRYGRRRALLAGLGLFGAGSAAAMTVTDPGWLIAMRGVLGVGAALVMPATLSTITSTFPREQRERAVGAWAGVAGASAILGLLASGVLLEVWSWRAVFGLNVVLAVVAIVATLRVIPESADPEAPKLDLVGALITVAGLGTLVYSIIEAPTAGWSSATPWSASPPGWPCWAPSSPGSCATRLRCSTPGCSATARSPPGRCRSPCSSSRSSASSSWSCSTCSWCAARARWCRRSAWSRWRWR